MKHLNTIALLATFVALPTARAGGGTANVQIVHNCADLAAATVDVYVGGVILLDDFAFRTATPFVEVPAGVPLVVGIAPGNSTGAGDAIYEQTLTLADGGVYVVVASGIVSGSGYMPAVPFTLAVYDQARTVSVAGVSGTDLLVMHGATDAPVVDIYERAVLNVTAVDDIGYGSFAGYLELPTDDYIVEVRNTTNSAIVAAYGAPLATLGLGGAAITVFASGFLDPSMNSNGPSFGLYVSTPAGGPLVALPVADIPTARVQVVHNSADLAAASVDVWLNDALLLNDLSFRSASPFVDAQAGVPFVVSIAPPNSTDTSTAIAHYTYTLAEDGSYILVANGIVSTTGYSPVQPFNLYVVPGARESATDPANTDILVFHGATDAPTVDVAEISLLGGATIVDDLSYGESAGYLEVPTEDYVLQVRTSDGTPLVSYVAPLATLALTGEAITVFASGFLDPAMNSNGEAFGLWVSLASGGALVELPIATGMQEGSLVGAQLALYPNPATENVVLEIAVDQAARLDLRIIDTAGRVSLLPPTQALNNGMNRVQLNVATLAEGMYTMLLRTPAGSSSLPLSIVR